MKHRIKIAFIVTSIYRCGPLNVVHELVNKLNGSGGVECEVYYLDKDDSRGLVFNAKVNRLKLCRFPFKEYDIIHTHGLKPDFFAFIFRKKIKYHISTIHNQVFDDLRLSYNPLTAAVFGNLWLLAWTRADRLVCVSDTLSQYYLKWFSKPKIITIHNGIGSCSTPDISDQDFLDKIAGYNEKGLKILGFTGVLSRRKGLEQLLAVTAQNRHLYAVVLIGNGKAQRRLMNMALEYGIDEVCYFAGFKVNPLAYYRYFDIVVIPSRAEGFCLTLAEAVQQRRPVVCSNINVFKELFSESEISFFTLDNIESLAESLINSEMTSSVRTSAAYEKYLKSYTSEQMAEKYLGLYLGLK